MKKPRNKRFVLKIAAGVVATWLALHIVAIGRMIVLPMYLEARAREGVASIPALMSYLDSDSEVIAHKAARLLARMGDDAAIPLSEVVVDCRYSSRKRRMAATAMGWLGDHNEESLRALRVGLAAQDSGLRGQCIIALWRLTRKATEGLAEFKDLFSAGDNDEIHRLLLTEIITMDDLKQSNVLLPILISYREKLPNNDRSLADYAIDRIKRGSFE